MCYVWPCGFNFKSLLFYRIDKPKSNFQHKPLTYWLRRGCGLAGLGNFQAAAKAPEYSAVQFSNCAELFCIWVKLSA